MYLQGRTRMCENQKCSPCLQGLRLQKETRMADMMVEQGKKLLMEIADRSPGGEDSVCDMFLEFFLRWILYFILFHIIYIFILVYNHVHFISFEAVFQDWMLFLCIFKFISKETCNTKKVTFHVYFYYVKFYCGRSKGKK